MATIKFQMQHLQALTSTAGLTLLIGSECSICQCEIKEEDNGVEFNQCKHSFHRECIQQWFTRGKISCPNCGILYEKVSGGQPQGEMMFNFSRQGLQGYPGIPSIEVWFRFPDGIQEDRHPKPGEPYSGTSRLCFFPATN